MSKEQLAFPTFHKNEITGYIPPESAGMTLRDYFAAKAMQSLLGGERGGLEDIPKWAYRYADAMLKARDNGNS